MTHPAIKTKEQRLISDLRRENADLRAQLEQARNEVSKLKAAIRLVAQFLLGKRRQGE